MLRTKTHPLPRMRHACVPQRVRARFRCASSASSPQRGASGEGGLAAQAVDQLRLIEAERDQALRVAEASARSAAKLEEMGALLERLALDRLRDGDEDGARAALVEKSSVEEARRRSGSRAEANFALAGKLAHKIGAQHTALQQLLLSEQDKEEDVATTAASSDILDDNITLPASVSSGSSSTSSSASMHGHGGGSASRPQQLPWQASLLEARERIKSAEAEAAASGRAADRQARESIEAARERLRAQARGSLAAAQSRIAQSASESIGAARARIAAEDAALLAEVRRVVARYRAGEDVPEATLSWAFQQLERRAWRGT